MAFMAVEVQSFGAPWVERPIMRFNSRDVGGVGDERRRYPTRPGAHEGGREWT